MNICSIQYCQRLPQYSYGNNSYYSKCPYHGLIHSKCAMDFCFKLTEYSIMKKEFYKFCPKHGSVKAPKCINKKCSNLTEFSPTMGIFHSKCPEHGTSKKLCSVEDCKNTTSYNYDNEKFNIKCDIHLDTFKMNDKIIKVCEGIEQNLLFQWIISPFKSLSVIKANKIQPMWENYIMAKNNWLGFWFELNDIANSNNISIDTIISYLKKSKINLMHAELVREPKAIRFANNNCDMLYDKKMALWIHTYLNTYKIIVV